MKRLLTTTVCSIPLAFASIAFAQTTPPPATGSPGAETPAAPGTTAPAASGAPSGTMPSPGAGEPMMSPDATQPTETITGWSVKDKMIGQSVYNENEEKVGDVNDVVLASDGKAAYYVVGAGGFLGMGQHDVAIPYDEIQRGDDQLLLQGYTKDELKALPRVELAE